MKYEVSNSIINHLIRAEEVVGMTFENHIHLSYEIFCVTEGEVFCSISGKGYTIKAGQAVIVFPGQIHSYRTDVYSKSKMLIFSPDFIAEFHSFVKNREFGYPVINYDASSLILPDTNEIFAIKGLLYSIVAQALRQQPLVFAQERNQNLIQKIISYISEHSTEKISLDDIANTIGYSYNYLSNCIKSNFGVNFATLVNNYRLENAATLLKSTDLSIAEIAQTSGFSTIRSFNRAFKKVYDITPSEFSNKKG